MTNAPEPEDKLDATTDVVVNGPEDAPFDWRQIKWRRVEDEVRRLRQRIFTAAKAGDLARVRNLQKLMLRSRANTLLSVRRVTERNAGRLTAGVDGEVVLTPQAKARLADRPVIADRAHQARVVSALEPEWEARFEPRSYGFRPGRGCHDAIEAAYHAVKGKDPKRRWVLDADLAQAFDKLGHDHILNQLGTFPARGMIRQWLKAGVVDQGRLHRTEAGVPQGGVVSPVLLNVALHGIEKAAGVRYYPSGQRAGRIVAAGSPTLIRYADDLLALCHSRQEALEIKARLADWLAPRGLSFNEDKTRVVSLEEGFDLLGFNVRRYGPKSLIKPSKAAQRRIRERLRNELRSLRGTNAQAVIKRLNPIIRGWAAYYRTQVSSEAFSELDHYLWRLTWQWATYSHQNKPKSWVVHRYFGMFNRSRQDRWVFGDRPSGAYMHRFSWTKIRRHQIVMGTASPDDPALLEYWASRRRKATLPINKTTRRLIEAQDGRCSICGGTLIADEAMPQNPREWEKWLTITRDTINTIATRRPGTSDEADVRLGHADCRKGNGLALHNAHEPLGLA